MELNQTRHQWQAIIAIEADHTEPLRLSLDRSTAIRSARSSWRMSCPISSVSCITRGKQFGILYKECLFVFGQLAMPEQILRLIFTRKEISFTFGKPPLPPHTRPTTWALFDIDR